MNNVYNLADAIIGPLKPQPARKAAFAPEPADIHKIELSIADPRLDDYLANVGPQLLCLCPSDQIATAVGFEIPGRNAYAVKVGVYMTQSQWPGATDYTLFVVPDIELTRVLPPEYVEMLEPKTLVNLRVVAGI